MTSPSPQVPDSGRLADVALVLIVDDNEKNRKLARDVLRAAGLRTLEAARGEEAITLATDHQPDVILLEGTPEEVSADPRVREVYLGKSGHRTGHG